MTPFIGQIQAFGFNFPPRGWALCNGNLISINENQALFSLLGTTYGGDGRTTFALPDLRGRSIVHPGTGPGLSNIVQGQKFGAQETFLTTANLPPHNHIASLKLGNAIGSAATGTNSYLAFNAVADTIFTATAPTDKQMGANTVTTANTGNGTSFSNRPPSLGIYVSIALVGIFPSRN